MDRLPSRRRAPQLYPKELRDEIDEVAQRIYTEVNNGVYRCGFAGSQQAYDKAYDRLFTALDWLTDRLERQRYLVGDTITEADVRLFTTLARFDPVYHGHFKCNRSKLAEMPVLWAYARDLFQTPGFGDTIDFVQIKQHYYIVHSDINPTRIVPKGPELSNWLGPHGREALGGRPFGDGTRTGSDAGRRTGTGGPFGLGPYGSDRPLGVRHLLQFAGGIQHQGQQLNHQAGQPAAVGIHASGSSPPTGCPGGTPSAWCRSGPRRPEAAATAPFAIAAGTDSCTGSRSLTGNSPCVPDVWQALRLSTSQYRYGPTRVRCPREYALISGCCGSWSWPSRQIRSAVPIDATTATATSTARTRFTPAPPPNDRPLAQPQRDGCRRSRESTSHRCSSPTSAPGRESAPR